MKKLAITGATGLIGSRIVELLKNNYTIVPLSSTDCDITVKEEVDSKLEQLDFDFLLHLAGYTDVDGAEKNRERAHLVNVTGTHHLFDAIQKKEKHMIYISTDFVFDGTKPPYFEDSSPNPQGYYAQTKYEGEKIVKDAATIIRISYPYDHSTSLKQDFVYRLKALLEQGKELHMITDGSITPTYIDDIAMALDQILKDPKPELYHIVGSQSISPFESGQMIAKHFSLSDDLIKPITYTEYIKDRAPRPQYSEIKSNKNTFCTMKSFSEGLAVLP